MTACASTLHRAPHPLRALINSVFLYTCGMPSLVVFLRGVNVGGHRRFRPSLLAKELSNFDVVNVGAAGTFVVRKPGSRTKFRAALLAKLPFEAEVVICDRRDIIRLATANPFGPQHSRPDHVRFVSILTRTVRVRPLIPVSVPAEGQWLVRVIASEKQFVFGVYRPHMKTIGYLGQLDKLCGAPVTTRNWNTILAIARIFESEGENERRGGTQARRTSDVVTSVPSRRRS